MEHFYAEFTLFNAPAEEPKTDAGGGLTFPFMAVDGATSSIMFFSSWESPEKELCSSFLQKFHPEGDWVDRGVERMKKFPGLGSLPTFPRALFTKHLQWEL